MTIIPNLYRSRHGMVAGVLSGIAESKNIPVMPLRIGFMIICFMTSFIPMIIIYAVFAFIMPMRGEGDKNNYQNNSDFREFSKRYKHNREVTVDEIKREFEATKRRVIDLESKIIDKDKDWERRFRN